VTSVSPDHGSVAGGTSVAVSGTGFGDADGVFFGGVAATSFSVLSDSAVVATAPPGTGTVDITVHNPGGPSATSGADAYRYLNKPVVTGLSPSSGPEGGGTSVTISGSGFATATAVAFGSSPAYGFTVIDDHTIVASAATGTGQVEVGVTSDIGVSDPTPAATYTYVPRPVISAVTPSQGPVAGGTTVTITGSHFSTATRVVFGDVSVPFTVVSDSAITLTTPAHARGVVVPEVVTVGGNAWGGSFEYMGPPVITSVSPSSGSVLGGTVVTVSGLDLVNVQSVVLVDNSSIHPTRTPVAFTVANGSITFTTPTHLLPATVGIEVTTRWGTSSPSSAARFTYKVL